MYYSQKNLNVLKALFLFLFILLPITIRAANPDKILWEYQIDASGQIMDVGWGFVNTESQEFNKLKKAIVFSGTKDFGLFKPAGFDFNFSDYDELYLVISTDKNATLNLYTNLGLQKEMKPTVQYDIKSDKQEYKIPLIGEEFNQKITSLAIIFNANTKTTIEIQKISLNKKSVFNALSGVIKEYLATDSYRPYLVNFFIAPTILGKPALLYLLPIVIILLGAFFTKNKYQLKAGAILLAIWLLMDFRMSYEFLSYQINDYHSWIKPAYSQKMLRDDGDFYQFVDWLNIKLPQNTKEVKFIHGGNIYLRRKLKYFLYPIQIASENSKAETLIIYNALDVEYNEVDKKLYQEDGEISLSGNIIEKYNDNSFIFKVE